MSAGLTIPQNMGAPKWPPSPQRSERPGKPVALLEILRLAARRRLRAMRERGDILLVACYELGDPPLAVAWPAAFLERHGYAPGVMDVSVAPFDPAKVASARLVAISVPMHTALRLGVGIAERVRKVNPRAHVCFYGLYAALNADWLLATCADSVLAGELEPELVELASRLERGETVHGVNASRLAKLDFPLPRRSGLPGLESYARLERDGRLDVTGYVVSSRGCMLNDRTCPHQSV